MRHELSLRFTDSELSRLAPEATHQHYKGGLYKYLGPVRDTSDPEAPFLRTEKGDLIVAYIHIWPHSRDIFLRDKKEWEEVLPNGVRRFRPIGNGEGLGEKSHGL